MQGIIVGVGETQGSHHALTWAMGQAAVTRTTLTVLCVGRGEVRARQVAEEATAKARAQLQLRDDEPPAVTVMAVSGSPAEELIDAARDADLLVLGTREHSSFPRPRLGSVSDQVSHHAECPVVLVP